MGLWCLLAAMGCAHLEQRGRLVWLERHHDQETRALETGAGRRSWLAAGLWLVAGLSLAGVWWGRRRWPEGRPLDREDLALLRTARDAVYYLLVKWGGRRRGP